MKKIFDENGLLSGKRVLAATLVMGLLSSMTFFSAAAGHAWESQGNVVAEKSNGTKVTVFDKSDLDYLDGRIDAIEADVSTGKENLANALNPLGTNPSLGTPLSGTSTFNELMEAINHSQAIPDKTIGESVSIATEDYELASTVTGQTINSDTKISAATADNLSLGTSAWVDGSLLIGTGADNKNYYELGKVSNVACGNITLPQDTPQTIVLDFTPDLVFIMTEPKVDQYRRPLGFAEIVINNPPESSSNLVYVPSVLSLFTINNDVFSFTYSSQYITISENTIILTGDNRMTRHTFWIAIKYQE